MFVHAPKAFCEENVYCFQCSGQMLLEAFYEYFEISRFFRCLRVELPVCPILDDLNVACMCGMLFHTIVRNKELTGYPDVWNQYTYLLWAFLSSPIFPTIFPLTGTVGSILSKK